MLPLWVGTGPGSEERRAIAVVVIGGQTLCLLLTLLVTPVAYSLFETRPTRFGSRRRPSRRGGGRHGKGSAARGASGFVARGGVSPAREVSGGVDD
jgi:hypothetical protein